MASRVLRLTLNELRKYDGSDPSLPVYVAIKGIVYDVSTGPYSKAKGGGYSKFAGKEIGRALAKSSLNEEDIVPSLDGLAEDDLQTLGEWVQKFESKYPVVGSVTDYPKL
eukprot:TRINITY_DN5808_c0_g1_i1.p1 TRINITY_DN5808_c0_g1~~TRINITY_DN5808_c0_g1_i1.p1  ORF type:complete len:110 (-),score=16.67 TRINITY_DN5808_c0_g1_i1:95-424(-)